MIRKLLNMVNYISTAVFTVEMVIKLISHGLIFGRKTYLRDPWNILDGVIVIASLVDVILELLPSEDGPNLLSLLKVMRVMRALRPLRLISRYPSLKLAVEALIASLKEIAFVLVICSIFFIIFGILGVQMFKGQMHFCENADRFHNITTRIECKLAGFEWRNAKYNFDHLGQALLTLFTISTLDNWVSVMHQGIDAVGVDMQPRLNHNHWKVLYFVMFILIVGFMVLNMFVGVLVDKFQEANIRLKTLRRRRKALRCDSVLDANNSSLTASRDTLLDNLEMPPLFRSRWSRFIQSKAWKLLYDLVVLGNIICIASEHYDMSINFAKNLQNCYMACLFWYIIDAMMKIVAFGPLSYFRDRWHWLEVWIIVLSGMGAVVGLVAPASTKKIAADIEKLPFRILRISGIVRAFLLGVRVFKRAEGVWELGTTIKRSLPDIGNICILFFLFFFVYAALGVELLGEVVCSLQHPCQGLDPHANFSNFGMAFLTLFRILTGDNWSGILTDSLREDCDSMCQVNCCPNRMLTIFYFVTFILISQYVLLNVAVAMLMKGLKETHRELFEDSVAKAYITGKLDAMGILPLQDLNAAV